MNILRNLKTLTKTPGMLRQWIRWNLGRLGITPCIELPGADQVSGFRSFSEFWSASAMVPADEEVNFICKFASESGVLLDVGANLGCFSLTLARLRPNCSVHAFEPSPETLLRLKGNVMKNQSINVNVHPLALGKEPGHLQFIDDQASPATNHLLGESEVASRKTITVEVSTVDQFLKRNGDPDVAFLKIDVEGFEADVLRGALATLTGRRCRAGLIELCPGNLERVGSSVGDLLDTVERVGWRLHFLSADGSPGPIVEPKTASNTVLANVAMLPTR